MSSLPRPERVLLRYDAVLKDLFQRDHPMLLNRLTGGAAVRQSLNVELAIVEERRADLLFELDDQSLFLLDLQSTNDRNMGYRVGIYTLVGAQKYQRKVRAAVLYTGMSEMKMEAHLDTGSTKVDYQLIDIREISAEALMRGGPGDLALALLARGGPERMHEILTRAMKLEPPGRDRLLTQLAVLAGLRRLDKRLRMEIKQMDSEYVDIWKNVILRDAWVKAVKEGMAEGKVLGKAEGRAEAASAMLSGLLEEKFGPLPAWASTRLRRATPEQTLRWSRKVLTAASLKEIVGRK